MAKESTEIVEVSDNNIRNLIYYVRGQQVMLDSDLAMLYQVETRSLNQAVKRNIKRFPEKYCFQLTKEEYENLKSQIVISSSENNYGGRRKLPYVFNEQGIAMLSAVLRSDIAIQVSIRIMDVFVEIRRLISNNLLLIDKVNDIEVKQLEFQKETDHKFEQIFEYISEREVDKQTVFFDGQIYDAFSFIIGLIKQAEESIVLVDGYVDVETLDMLSKRRDGVNILIVTYPSASLSNRDVRIFNEQYHNLTVKRTSIFHDRFIIIDEDVVYHIGASAKDAGKKCFGINLVEDDDIKNSLKNKISQI